MVSQLRKKKEKKSFPQFKAIISKGLLKYASGQIIIIRMIRMYWHPAHSNHFHALLFRRPFGHRLANGHRCCAEERYGDHIVVATERWRAADGTTVGVNVRSKNWELESFIFSGKEKSSAVVERVVLTVLACLYTIPAQWCG